jgi:hypothetical protein
MPREGVFICNNRESLTDITELNIPLDVLEISIQSCRVNHVPIDFFMRFTQLESLNLQNNYIPILPNLPPNLTYLNISYNRLTEFILDAANNQRLEFIDIKYNLIPEFPVIINKPEGLIIKYKGNNREYDEFNELDFVAQEAQNRRRRNAIARGINPVNVVDNRQQILEATNVHDSKIQSNTHKSIAYLLGTIPTQQELDYDQSKSCFKYDSYYLLGIIGVYGDIIKEEMVNMQKMFGNAGNLILSYRALLKEYDELNTTIIYDYGLEKGCTMSQILERIWVNSKFKRAKMGNRYIIEPRSIDEQKSIISNLIIQMEDGEKMCFVGKFTRVVSSLVSFDENIQLEISFPIRFGNAVDYLKTKGMYTKENLIRFVNDSELEDNEKRNWIKSIDDMFEEEMVSVKEVAIKEEPLKQVKEEIVEEIQQDKRIILRQDTYQFINIGFIPWRP